MTPPSSTYVVLGLLAKQPGSGYDTAAFADRSVRHFWPISRTQLYSELTRLEGLGWVTGTTVQQDRYPDKRVYEPTTAGLAALRAWLDEPVARARQRTQDTVALKTFFGAYMDPGRLADQLRQCRAEAEKLHAELTGVVEHLDAKGPTRSRAFGRAAARYGVLKAEATIAWTDEVRELLAVEEDQEAEAG
ncbi:PadR family transcriptional regulator [Actinokineospora sp.]|uniref:PadR family transcriptional regulator n=1 Tax=Actinokineospora sp. TaxID=1872133 RepID=UPI004037B46C